MQKFKKKTRRRSSIKNEALTAKITELEKKLETRQEWSNMESRSIDTFETHHNYNSKLREAVYFCQSFGVSSRNTSPIIENIVKTVTGKVLKKVSFRLIVQFSKKLYIMQIKTIKII